MGASTALAYQMIGLAAPTPALAAEGKKGGVLKMQSEGITLQTNSGEKLMLSPLGITLQTASGQKLSISPQGIELSNGVGQGTITLQQLTVSINNGALEVT